MAEVRVEEYVVRVERCPITGSVLKEATYLEGQLHVLDRPAMRRFHPDTGALIEELWRRRGYPNRESGPCSTEWHPKTGVVLRQAWANDAGFHRAGGLAAIWRRDAATGVIVGEDYYEFGKMHRINGPAEIDRDATTGHLRSETWWQYDQKTREGDRPAHIEYGPDGKTITREEYWLDGDLHREAGPAIIVRSKKGRLLGSLFFIKGERQPSSLRVPPGFHP